MTRGGSGRPVVLLLAAMSLFAVSCGSVQSVAVSMLPDRHPTVVVATSDSSVEEEFVRLQAELRHDLDRAAERQSMIVPGSATPSPVASTQAENAVSRERVRITSSNLFSTLRMPILGVDPDELVDSWGEPRDGGRRRHKGIDIFASRGSEVIAVADGYISYIGTQPKGGRCLWLATETGLSFYYAHLDRWAAGIYEGMEVHGGDVIGFVGNTGNAMRTSPHLHFQVVRDDETVDPYPLLRGNILVSGRTGLAGGFGR